MHTGSSCFSYPADVPPGTGTRDAAQSAQCGYLNCFSYPADVPPGTGTRDAARPSPACSTASAIQADVPPGLRRMPGGTCFRY